MLQDAVKDALGTISWQVGEDNDDYLVVSIVAASRLGLQEQSLVMARVRTKITSWGFPWGPSKGRRVNVAVVQVRIGVRISWRCGMAAGL